MKFNLDYLKFHSFKFDKKTTNEYLKYDENLGEYSEIWENFKEVIKSLEGKNYNQILSFSIHNHTYDRDKIAKILKVIEICHKNLNEEIAKIILKHDLNPSKLNFIQIWIKSHHRVVAIHNSKTNEIIPVLFDLNHCFYFDPKHQTSAKSKHEWNFKDRQIDLKKQVM